MNSRSYADALALSADLSPAQAHDLVVERLREPRSGVVVAVNTQRPQDARVLAAAADAITPDASSDVTLYVTGYGTPFDTRLLEPFAAVGNVNVNSGGVTDLSFLGAFTALQTLTVQGQSGTTLSLAPLAGLRHLTRLAIRAGVRDAAAVSQCTELRFVSCSSNIDVLRALVPIPALHYLDVLFGSNRDLHAIAAMPALCGVALYQVRGLGDEDLMPLAECQSLQVLSLGALRNVTRLSALLGGPRHTLKALLLERIVGLASFDDIGSLDQLIKLGLWESRPSDKRLSPLAGLGHLRHLVIGDVYPASEIQALESSYDGSLHYRNRITRGEFTPRWRTPIDRLDVS